MTTWKSSNREQRPFLLVFEERNYLSFQFHFIDKYHISTVGPSEAALKGTYSMNFGAIVALPH